ncbi:MAG: hypothetical protein N2255_07515 [Kiritimatiellae bacterium]|nr:hypothetical protein [Kiritimatiellia bacterium]
MRWGPDAHLILLGGLLVFSFSTAAEHSRTARTVTGIHISTDRSVDFFSRETILASILRPETTDEEKAIACWRLVNRHVFHFCRPDDNDPLRVLNVYGYALCGTIQHVLAWLFQGALGPDAAGHAGLSSRDIEDPDTYRIVAGGWLVDSMLRLDASKPPTKLGHTWCELYYGGRAHYLDSHAGFFVYTADGKTIASITELSGDWTLVTDPVRTSDIFMPCDDGRPEFFYRCTGGSSRAAPEKTDHSMAMRLRPGETICLYFDRLPGRYFKRSESWKNQWAPEYYENGPEHRCANGRERHWRHYGNGELVFTPNLARSSFREATVKYESLVCQAEDGKPGLHPAQAGTPGVIAFAFEVPYVIVGGEIEAVFDLPLESKAHVRLTTETKPQHAQQLWEATGKGGRERCAIPVDASKLHYPYRVVLEVSLQGAGTATLPSLLELRARFITQLNFTTLPRPKPGSNRIRVQSDARALHEPAFFIEWAWTEKGGVQKFDRQRVSSADFSYQLTIGEVETRPEENPKYLRWLKLELPDE